MPHKGHGKSKRTWPITLLLGVMLLAWAFHVQPRQAPLSSLPTDQVRVVATLEKIQRHPDIRPGATTISAHLLFSLSGASHRLVRQGVLDPEVDPGFVYWRGDSGGLPLARLQQGERIPLWVDPDRPTAAHLHPAPPPAREHDFLFRVLLYLGLPIVLLGLVQGYLARRHPIVPRAKPTPRPSWMAAGVGGSFLALPLYAQWPAGLDSTATGWFIHWGQGEILTGIGLLLGVAFPVTLWRWRVGRIPPLTFTTRLRTGSALGGFVTFVEGIGASEEAFAVTLSCQTTEKAESGGPVLLWSETQQVSFSTGGRLIFRFMVPPRMPGSGRKVSWRLALSGQLHGRSIDRKYAVEISGMPLDVLEKEWQLDTGG